MERVKEIEKEMEMRAGTPESESALGLELGLDLRLPRCSARSPTAPYPSFFRKKGKRSEPGWQKAEGEDEGRGNGCIAGLLQTCSLAAAGWF